MFFLSFRPFRQQGIAFPFLVESNAFAGAFGAAHSYVRVDGRVMYGPIQHEYLDMLRLLAGWYADGLINPSIEEPNRGRNWIEVAGKSGAVVGSFGLADFFGPLDYIPAPFPKLSESDTGYRAIGSRLNAVNDGFGAAVSSKSVFPEEAVRWLDTAYGEYGNVLFNFGIEDASFVYEGGKPVLMDELRGMLPDSFGRIKAAKLHRYSRGLVGGPFVLSSDLVQQQFIAAFDTDLDIWESWTENAYEPVTHILNMYPQLAVEFQRLNWPIEQHFLVNFAAFVTGQRSLDEFDAFVREIRGMGGNETVDILDRAWSSYENKYIPGIGR